MKVLFSTIVRTDYFELNEDMSVLINGKEYKNTIKCVFVEFLHRLYYGLDEQTCSKYIKEKLSKSIIQQLFYWACIKGYVELLPIFIENGASISKYDEAHGCTGLHYACAALQNEVVEFLIQRGAKCNVKDKEGKKLPLQIYIEALRRKNADKAGE